MDILAIVYAVAVLGGLGAVFGLVLGYVGNKFAVEVDERVTRVRETLGGANCGACGYAGCDAFADAVVKGEAPANGCTPGGLKTAKAIGGIMGLAVTASEPMVARVRCQGTPDHVSPRYDYTGLPTCRAAAAMSGGPKMCEFGCLGLGDCMHNCAFGAIKLENGVAVIDDDVCTGCGVCVKTCPRSVITLTPKSKTVAVLCRNKAIGRIARLQCKTACVGCKRCEKNCPSDSIHVVDGVAEINPDTCTRCGACVEGCPMHCIVNYYLMDLEEERAEERAEERE